MKTSRLLIVLVALPALLLAGCTPDNVTIGPLQTESRSVELGDAESVRAEIDLGAGDLNVTGGAEELLEADFSYNVDRMKPRVTYADGTLRVEQPGTTGLRPSLRDIKDYRSEWNLRLSDQVPLALRVNVDAGKSDLHLADLALTQLDVILGIGSSTIDLSGGWERDLDVTINSGAANTTLRLPKDVGARVEIEDGPHAVEARGLAQTGNVYTNAAYGVSAVTLSVNVEAAIGTIVLEVEEAAAASD